MVIIQISNPKMNIFMKMMILITGINIEGRAYIPSNHGGSFISSTSNNVFRSGEETNFICGGLGIVRYFVITGNTACIF